MTPLDAILNSPPDLVIFALDTEYRYLAFNENHRRTMHQLWGCEIAVGLDIFTAIGPNDRDRAKARVNFDRALAGESFTLIEAYGAEGQRRFYRDSYSPVRHEGAVIGVAVFLVDVTREQQVTMELRRHQDELESLVTRRTAEVLHSQKLESLGVLAGGIAHDFNNILTGILVGAEFAEGLEDPEAIRAELARIRRSARRGAELTNQLLAYAGRAESHLARVDLPVLVEEVIDVLGATVCRRAHVTRDFSQATPAVLADPVQLRQVCMNLLTNAAEAGSTNIVVRVEPAVRERVEGARLSVQDDGEGMDDATLTNIFDPFYTTKRNGRGLGLAAVRGIVTNHAGHLDVDTVPGGGTRFDIWLPADDGTVDVAVNPEPSQDAALTAHVLVVDDDPAVRSVCQLVLEHAGGRVTLAQNGAEAVRVIEADTSVQIVLLDLTMPGPSARATLDAIRVLRPSMPMVLFSGYAEKEARQSLGEVSTGFVAKPFGIQQLLSALQGALASA